MTYRVINPHSGREISSRDTASPVEVRAALERSRDAFEAWRRVPLEERAELLRSVAAELRDHADEHARLMAEEMGKPVADGRGEAEKCAWVCEYYAEHASDFLADEPADSDAAKSYVSYRPLGPVLAIMPWNFPYWQVFRFAAPGLMAGNVALLKHASNVPGCAEGIERIFADAGAPGGLFQNMFLSNEQAGDVIRSAEVRAVALTGSVRAGRSVAEQAGAEIKKTVLELGGSDAYVVLADADVELAAEQCVKSRLTNSGQSCIAAKRFVVVEELRDAFTEAVVARMEATRMGDPLDESSRIGPQARHDLRDALHEQVERSVAAGAGCLLGGSIPDGPGAYYPPTVLTDVAPGMPAYEEEMFGPVAAILCARNTEDAIRIANDSAFGLGAAVFTEDVAEGERIARDELNAGCCFVNAFVRSDPRLPFGGILDSGYGRELGRHGIREFVNAKTVYVA